jgi:hypothetical protein
MSDRLLVKRASARVMATSSGSSSNGLKRTAIASDCGAIERVLSSVLPVSIVSRLRPESLKPHTSRFRSFQACRCRPPCTRSILASRWPAVQMAYRTFQPQNRKQKLTSSTSEELTDHRPASPRYRDAWYQLLLSLEPLTWRAGPFAQTGAQPLFLAIMVAVLISDLFWILLY